MLTVYGIKNCNTVKSALNWLDQHNVSFEFHDFKTKGVTATRLKAWSSQVGWENLVNKRGTTWRQLPPEVQNKITSQTEAINLMKEKTSVIKRPVVVRGDEVVAVGFDPETYARVLRAR